MGIFCGEMGLFGRKIGALCRERVMASRLAADAMRWPIAWRRGMLIVSLGDTLHNDVTLHAICAADAGE